MKKDLEKKILVRTKENIGFLELSNIKKLNAISLSMWKNLGEALEEFAANSLIRCVMIKGTGNKAFSAGADISEFEENRSDSEDIRLYENTSKNTMSLLKEFPKPTVASINGYCIGGGLALALCCDIRIASVNSTFGIPAAKLGLAYGFNGIKLLTSIVGPAKAKYIFFTARKFDALQAKEFGILEEVYSIKDLDLKTKQLIENIALNAPLTIKSAKMAIDSELNDKKAFEECLKAEQDCFDSDDYAEGRAAFAEKRKPVFKGH